MKQMTEEELLFRRMKERVDARREERAITVEVEEMARELGELIMKNAPEELVIDKFGRFRDRAIELGSKNRKKPA